MDIHGSGLDANSSSEGRTNEWTQGGSTIYFFSREPAFRKSPVEAEIILRYVTFIHAPMSGIIIAQKDYEKQRESLEMENY